VKLIDKLNSLDIPRTEASYLVRTAMEIDLTQFYDLYYKELTQTQLKLIDFAFHYHKKCVPLSRLFGRKFFWKDDFYVSPFTLDPRPETEVLVEYCISLKPKRILDIGSGSGCILLSILRDLPDSVGLGIDISRYSIETAVHNANKLGIKADFIQADINYFSTTTQFDLIVSNPPYIKKDCSYEALFDPPISLWDNDVYSAIFRISALNSNGCILFEIPEYSKKDIIRLAQYYHYNLTFLPISSNILICKAVKLC